jgi:hypothetical protein
VHLFAANPSLSLGIVSGKAGEHHLLSRVPDVEQLEALLVTESVSNMTELEFETSHLLTAQLEDHFVTAPNLA